MPREHLPVLPRHVLELLAPRPGEVYADATAGLGGHAALIAERLGEHGTIILNDLDPEHLLLSAAHVREHCAHKGVPCPCIEPIHGSFADLPARLRERGVRANMLLADLGFASDQIDDPARGLSFLRDGPLDMRFDPTSGVPASALVNDLSERDLADLIYEFGEERASRRIARRIVEQRRSGRIETTAHLAQIVRTALGVPARGGSRPGRIDPATRTFQALRIAVNDEIGALRSLLGAIESDARRPSGDPSRWLGAGARIAIIAFHSLEDRPVKQAFAGLRERGLARALTRGAIKADEDEIARNRRSRSARLRAIRLPEQGDGDAPPPLPLRDPRGSV